MNIKKLVIEGLAVYGACTLVKKIYDNYISTTSPTESLRTRSYEPVQEQVCPEKPARLRDYIHVEVKTRQLANDFMDFLKWRKNPPKLDPAPKMSDKNDDKTIIKINMDAKRYSVEDCLKDHSPGYEEQLAKCVMPICGITDDYCKGQDCPILKEIQTRIAILNMKGDK